ncbi:MAG: thiamine phosphate synthase [Planctomycetota bacterium]
MTERDRRERLDRAKLYLLATTTLCRVPLAETIREAVAGGVDVVQLREKNLHDPDFRALALRIGDVVRDAGALFIVNDRVEIAGSIECDGVHVGQEDAPVFDVRAALGPDRLIGLSTHSIEQASEAVAFGADSIGIGPVFPTETKDTGYEPRGVALAGDVTRGIPLPAFAIGGITEQNLPELLAAGARRIAVSSAICSAEDPRAAAARLKEQLTPGDRAPAARPGSASRSA